MSPASSGGIVPLRVNDQEVRRRAVSGRGHDKQVARTESTNREPSHIPTSMVTDQRDEHSRLATESYYCEPVWWSAIRRFWTNKIGRQSDRCRSRNVKTEQTIAECVLRQEGVGRTRR